MRILSLGPSARALASASSLSLAFGCSLQDFDPLSDGIGSGGTGGTSQEGGAGGDGGSGSESGSGGANGGSAGDGGDAGTQAGQGGTAGTEGGDGGNAGGPPVNPGELMTDPSFETGVSGWAAFGTGALLTRVQSEFRTGETSLLCSNRSAFWNGAGFALNTLTASAPDAQYTLSMWIRAVDDGADAGPLPQAREITLTLKTRCGTQTDDTAHYDPLSAVALTNAWTLITGNTTFPRHCTNPSDYRVYLAESIAFEEQSPFPNFYIDDASVMLTE